MDKVTKTASLQAQGNAISVIFTKEVEDRDGETVIVKGIDYSSFLDNPVVLDSHKADSVMDILGRAKNLRVMKSSGVDSLIGDIEFADHPKAKYAEQMVRKGELNTVSIGFRVKEYDNATKAIPKSELFELSFVPIPANPEAKVVSKQAKFHEMTKTIDQLEDAENVYKKLAVLEDIHPKIKEFRKLFMSDELFGELGIEKTGDELLDIKNLFDNLTDRIKSEEAEGEVETPVEEEASDETQETPEEETEVETPQEEVKADDNLATPEEIAEVFNLLQNLLT